MFCTKCGTRVDEVAQFCPKCGASLSEEDDSEILSGDTGAVDAATPSSTEQLLSVEAAPKKKRGWKALAIAGSLVVVVAVLGVGGFFLSKSLLPSLFSLTFVNEKAFPDEGLRNLVAEQFDLDHDGILTEDEISGVVHIDFSDLSQDSYEQPSFEINSSNQDSIAKVGATTVSTTPAMSPDEEGSSAETISDENASTDEAGTAETENPDSTEASHIHSIAGLEYFTGLESLNCAGMGLETLDLSKYPSLKYIDCRNNSLTSLDLSSNSSLVTLYCDDGVEVTGLENANLYEETLMTQIQYSGSSGEGTENIYYDWIGRPVLKSSTFSGDTYYYYDELGRISSSLTPDEDKTFEYSYNSQGLPEKTKVTIGSDFNVETTFAYNDAQQLISYSTADAISGDKTSRELLYNSAGKLMERSLSSEIDGIESYATTRSCYVYNSHGKLVACSMDGFRGSNLQQYQVADEYIYSGDYCTKMKKEWSSDWSQQETIYDGNGLPVETKISSSYSTDSLAYQCNPSGSLYKVETSYKSNKNNSSSNDARVLEMWYVKRISNMNNKATVDYAPSFKFEPENNNDLDSLWHQWSDQTVAQISEINPMKQLLSSVLPPESTFYEYCPQPRGTEGADAGPYRYENRYFSVEFPSSWHEECEIRQWTYDDEDQQPYYWIQVYYNDNFLFGIGGAANRNILGNPGLDMLPFMDDATTSSGGCVASAYWNLEHTDPEYGNYFQTLSEEDQATILALYNDFPAIKESFVIK